MACSRLLPRDSSRSLADHRPHVSRSTGFPSGLGVLGHPPTGPSPVDTCSAAQLRSSRLRPPCHGPDGRALMNRPPGTREPDTGVRRSSSPCAAERRPPLFAGWLGRVSESAADPLRPYPGLLAVAHHPRRLLPRHDDSAMGSAAAWPYAALLGGLPGRMPSDRHDASLGGLRVSRYPRGDAVSPTPGRQA
jgi:hypothetical protein